MMRLINILYIAAINKLILILYQINTKYFLINNLIYIKYDLLPYC